MELNKGTLTILWILTGIYVLSPIDLLPMIPVDDIIILAGTIFATIARARKMNRLDTTKPVDQHSLQTDKTIDYDNN